MNWYKESQTEKVIYRIKNILKNHPFTKRLSSYYNIPLSDIDNHLEIRIIELDGKFAEGNGKRIDIDTKLFDNDFFSENFHFIIHEFFHWLKRRAEAKFYLNDPEEVQSFVLQIVWQMIEGQKEGDIIKKIFPIIATHYDDREKAKDVFNNMMNKAKELYSIYNDKEEKRLY